MLYLCTHTYISKIFKDFFPLETWLVMILYTICLIKQTAEIQVLFSLISRKCPPTLNMIEEAWARVKNELHIHVKFPILRKLSDSDWWDQDEEHKKGSHHPQNLVNLPTQSMIVWRAVIKHALRQKLGNPSKAERYLYWAMWCKALTKTFVLKILCFPHSFTQVNKY